jgi:hypothetical protein
MSPLRLTLPFTLAAALAAAQEEEKEEPFGESPGIQFRVSGELKANFRWSQLDAFARPAFPPSFVPLGREQVELRTVSPGSSIEISKATVFFDVEFPRSIFGRIKVDFISLYDRNPTSSDRNVDVDEAYLRFGTKYESLEPIPGSHAYALFGKAPKFERQPFRRLESYGLVETAFNRFNDLQLQFGGGAGRHVYFRAQVSDGNPTFIRDPNALAGDNGVVPPPEPDITFDIGFPIYYHAEIEDVAFDDNFEGGFGGGVRFVSDDQERGLDVLGFYYRTTLSEAAKLFGTFYEGDLDIFSAAGVTLPIEGDERTEWGFNVDAELAGFGMFLQYVDEEAASLPRTGISLEVGYDLVLGDRGDPRALFTVVQPAIRYSKLDNDFFVTGFAAPSVFWDWTKVDVGARVTILQNIDLTLEYAFHDLIIPSGQEVNHDEFLTTLRFRFP